MKLNDAIAQTKGFASEYQEILITFLYVSKSIESKHKSFFKSFNITMQQYNVLRILKGASPSPCSLQYIRKRLLDKDSDASRLIERLRKNGWVSCEQNEDDLRQLHISLTPQGFAKLGEIAPYLYNTEKPFKVLSEEERIEFKSLLEKLIQ